MKKNIIRFNRYFSLDVSKFLFRDIRFLIKDLIEIVWNGILPFFAGGMIIKTGNLAYFFFAIPMALTLDVNFDKNVSFDVKLK